jgi:uncharacterized protein (DUF2141 family)
MRSPLLVHRLPAAVAAASAALLLPPVAANVRAADGTAPAPAASVQKSAPLIVIVTQIRSDRGVIAASLFAAGDGFPGDAKRAVRAQIVTIPLSAKSVTLTFADLPPGEYGLALLHDENKNGKMDTSFGFPAEGFGTSNNPRFGWRAPTWRQARFKHEATANKPTTLSIRIVYL